MKRFFPKLRNLLARGRAERELAREVDSHLALLQEDFERRGMPPQDAALAARRAYGGVEQAKELHRAERSFVWLEQLWQDFRHATRALARTPGFTALAVIALALGIGVNTTLFSTYNAVALKPLPVSDPDRVVRFERWVGSGLGNGQYAFSYPEFVYCRDHSDQFSSLVAASWTSFVLASPPESAATEQRRGQLVSANYFSDLGIPLRMGRGFLPQEDRSPGGNPVVVIGFRFWQRSFGSDPAVLGRTLKLNGAAFTVIGVTPEDFTGTTTEVVVPDFWAPLSMQAQIVPGEDWLGDPEQQRLQIFARLKSTASRPAAQAQADLLVRQFGATYVERDPTRAVTLQRTTYFPNTDDIRFQMLVAAIMLIVGLVLLAACANVGNMLLARSAARQREISTRLALGSSRPRLIRQLLSESVLLALLGGGAGLLLSVWSTKLLGLQLQRAALAIGAVDVSAVNLAPDGRVLLYVLGVSLASGVLFGLSPALRFTQRDLTTALKDDGASLGNLAGSKVRSFLVAGQVAVSVLLLAIAGLLSRGLVRSQTAEPGFETRSIFVVAGDFGRKTDPVKAAARRTRLLEKLRERPELAAVTLGSLPLAGSWTPPIIVDHARGRTVASYASENYFATLKIPLLRGRVFTSQETRSSAHLAVISESTARAFWPGEDPLGRSFALDMNFDGKLEQFEVIGIVKDVRYSNLSRLDPAHVYLPVGSDHLGAAPLLVRIQGDRPRALAAMASVVETVDRDLLPSLQLLNLDDGVVQLQRTLSQLFALLAGILAGLALALAGLGIYGVIAYVVSQRTREIGIRMALGANSAAVWKGVVLQGLRPVLAGMLLGLAAAAALSAVLHQTLIFPGSMDFLYGVPFYDPVTFGGMACFVLAVAALASAVPARRALRVDPSVALRYE